jgi:putative DNA primase/helicase
MNVPINDPNGGRLVSDVFTKLLADNPRGGAPPAPLEIITVRASDINPERINWLWKGWLALGKLELIAGVPEAGKTTIALSFAAAVSSGGMWPDGTKAPQGNVLIWTSEDDPSHPTLLSRGLCAWART